MEWHAPLRVRNAARSPLGRISLAGFIPDGEGIPDTPLRVLGSYAVVYLLDGSGRFQDEFGLDFRVRAGDLLVIFPDVAHTYGPGRRERWTEFYLCFDGPVFDLWRDSGLLNPAQPLHHLAPIEHWARRFEAVLGAPRRPGHAPPLLEVCRLQAVLSEALLAGRHGFGGEEADWADRACARLESDLERGLDLEDLAGELGMSYDGFRKRFARVVGMSPARYRGSRIVDRACELMQGGLLTDREIAEMLGFCDEYYFSRRFKQVTGVSPRRFRASLPMRREL